MKNATNTFNVSVGNKFKQFYSNGEYAGTVLVVRVNEKSCFISFVGESGLVSDVEHRYSWNTINDRIGREIYKAI